MSKDENTGRNLKRRSLIYYLVVYDADLSEVLGYLVDITDAGLKLVSNQPLAVGKRYNLQMELPEQHFYKKQLKVAARSQWTKPDINPDFSVTGFAFEELDEENADLITSLVKVYGFND